MLFQRLRDGAKGIAIDPRPYPVPMEQPDGYRRGCTCHMCDDFYRYELATGVIRHCRDCNAIFEPNTGRNSTYYCHDCVGYNDDDDDDDDD